jgi:hypothetical protein
MPVVRVAVLKPKAGTTSEKLAKARTLADKKLRVGHKGLLYKQFYGLHDPNNDPPEWRVGISVTVWDTAQEQTDGNTDLATTYGQADYTDAVNGNPTVVVVTL